MRLAYLILCLIALAGFVGCSVAADGPANTTVLINRRATPGEPKE